MTSMNHTRVTEFLLLGFPSLQRLHILLFTLGLCIYILTVTGNLLIIVIIMISHRLHSPLYFFLGNFSFLEIWYSSNIVPQMLMILLAEGATISYPGCIAQLYLFICLGSAECLILAVMAFDRYVAICNPLRYTAIMNNQACLLLALGVWPVAFLVNLPPLISFSRLHFCGPNVINHFFCDFPPLLKLSCTDTHLNELMDFVVAAFVIVGSFLLIMMSYALIVAAVVRIPSTTGRKKAFSTCASHLAIVVLFYGSLMFMYVSPKSHDSLDFNKVLSISYTMVTPVLNPIIYTLRNKEVKQALGKALCKKWVDR